MPQFSHDNLAKFAGVVAKVWNDKNLEKSYHENPGKVLAEHGIKLPEGVPTPVIPPRPTGANSPELGAAFKKQTFENWHVTVDHLHGQPAGLSISSLACAACPVSCFSSISN
jgi:hypothetical protein